MGYVLSKLPMARSRRPADTKRNQRATKKDRNHAGKSIHAAQHRKAPTTFHSYPKLPLELKHMIWEHTLPTQPRVIELKRVRWYAGVYKYGFSIGVSPPTPDVIKVALSADRASRAVVFRNYLSLKLGMRIGPAAYLEPKGDRASRGPVADKWLIPRRTVFMSERLGDTVVARSREVLVFPYRPARHGLDTATTTHICSLNWEEAGVGDETKAYDLVLDTNGTVSPGVLLEFFEGWWACLPQQEERDSSPVGWEAEIDSGIRPRSTIFHTCWSSREGGLEHVGGSSRIDAEDFSPGRG